MRPADQASLVNKPGFCRRRLLAVLLPFLVFFIVFPALLFLLPSVYFDNWLGLPILPFPAVRVAVGLPLIVLGGLIAWWATRAQREIGKGSPIPLMATRELVVQGPYSYCRNPIYLGLIVLFFGVSVWVGSISSMGMVLIFSSAILLYARFIEEKELTKRYGPQYTAYKQTTPFVIPRFTFQRRKY